MAMLKRGISLNAVRRRAYGCAGRWRLSRR